MIKRLRFVLIICLFSQISTGLSAQENLKSSFFIATNYFEGQNRPHRPEIQNLVYRCGGFDLKAGWLSNGNKKWQQAYRNPSYGIGLNYNAFETPILGTPIALYFFTEFPMIHYCRFKASLSYNIGASYGINPFDSIKNPENMATGTSGNAYFALFAEEELSITQRWSLTASQGFTHYSNGTLGFPNLGLNVPGYRLGLRYYTRPFIPYSKVKVHIEEKPWGGTIRVMTGAKKLNESAVWYKELVVNPLLTKQLSYKNRIGIGIEAAINQALRDRRGKENASFEEIITWAVNAQHEFLIERFSVYTQFGIYFLNQPTDKFYYERVGLSYSLSKYLKTGISLKAHYFKAEYVEASLSFDF